ncbi:hypothetical protein SCLCIDRAFT_1217003 [Scleroderma citrinum Foug A]|uniref:Carrier domain-containing protein n=1 Tax=Scleroderma citrinum Foug A TaxID=1036808 RepID=A0A0C3A680_9AGAM|nr:hypothetical protein SCLCIDRAFT_1217003 [Scleroderma citrinum Foug A]
MGTSHPDVWTNPKTLPAALSQAVRLYPHHELAFISSSSLDCSIKTKTLHAFYEEVCSLAYALVRLGRPYGSVIIVYLTEHEDNMTAIWACLLAGHVPCLQPSLSAQPDHKECHVAHLNNLLSFAPWLTDDAGAQQLGSISELKVYLFSELVTQAERSDLPDVWCAHTPTPDDDAMLFLTSGSTGFSKVVVHTHRTILAACYSKGQDYGLSSKSRTLNWVGFDHVAGSLEMHVTPLLFGAYQIHVHSSVILADSLQFLRLLDEKCINIVFAPNFLLAKLTHDLEARSDLFGQLDLSSLKRINSGGEAIVSKTVQAFIIALKNLSHNPSNLYFAVSPGFGMTETCAGCIYNVQYFSSVQPKHEFLDLGTPIPGCEMRIVDPTDGTTVRLDGQGGELQVRGPMVFVRYHNSPETTLSSFVDGGWYRTGDIGIIKDGALRLCGRIKDTLIVHGVSYSISALEMQLRAAEGVVQSSLAAAPYRALGQETESFIIFYSPSFDLTDEAAPSQLQNVHRTLQDVSLKMISLSPKFIIPLPIELMERSTLGKVSRARLIDLFERGTFAQYISLTEMLLRATRGSSFTKPSSSSERALAQMFVSILGVEIVSAEDNFFELGGTSIDVIRLKRECEATFTLPEIPTISFLKYPVLAALAHHIDTLRIESNYKEDYDPIIPFHATGHRTPLIMVHPGIGEVLIYVGLAKYFRNERPFYALRARGFETDQPFFTSMNEMVSCYVAAVKRIQPMGPYAIAGYSYGGVIAFEMAKRFESMGDDVKFLGLINIPPNITDRLDEIDWTRGLLNLAYFLGLLSREMADAFAPSIRPLIRAEQLAVVWKEFSPARVDDLDMTLEKLSHWVDVAGALVQCGKGYQPSGSVATMDVFYAIPPHGSKGDWLNQRLKGWVAFSRTEPLYTDIPGQHYTLLDMQHASQFQKILRERLEARGV